MIISFVTASSGTSRPSMPAMFFRTPSSRFARSEEKIACVDEPPSSPERAFNSNIAYGITLERQGYKFAQSLVTVFTPHHAILAMRDGLLNSADALPEEPEPWAHQERLSTGHSNI